MGAGMGFKVRVGLGSTSTVDQPLEVTSESIALQEQFVDTAGLRGTRDHRAERLRRGTRQVGGALVCTPSPLELDYLLPKIAGGTKGAVTTNVIDLAETLPEFYITVDRDTKVLTYDGCKVASAQFQAAVGGPLTVTANIVGKDETVGNTGTFPAITPDVTGAPYMLSDLALVVGGTTYYCSAIDFTLDNMLDVQFFNSETPTRITPMDRNVTINIQAPYGDAAALHGSALGGVAVVATFTQGTRSFVATFGAVSAPRNSAVSSGRGEIILNWSGVSRATGSTPSLSFTNDSTA
jgi:hypothetical protein